MGKHAYLIIAHNNFETLEKIIKLIDDTRNDIFIHIDIKAGELNKDRFNSIVHDSNIEFVERIDVKWAGYSQIKCEMILLEAATKRNNYDYYHLISGADLPIKTQNQIHEFFDANNGIEFVEYDDKVIDKQYLNRVEHSYLFQDIYGRNRKNPIMIGLYILDNLFEKMQQLLKINRVKDRDIIWQKGPNWFSITDCLARHIVSQKNDIEKIYIHSRSGDEMFLQTALANSEFKNNVYKGGVDKINSPSLRKIDWNRGKPYTFKKDDFDELMNDSAMFARKFNQNEDEEIIDMIYERLKGID